MRRWERGRSCEGWAKERDEEEEKGEEKEGEMVEEEKKER